MSDPTPESIIYPENSSENIPENEPETNSPRTTQTFNSFIQSQSCKMCNRSAKYRCPKCTIFYCSLDCYRIHSEAKCSEEFYEHQVNTNLKGKFAPKEDRKKMKNIINQYRNFEDCEETAHLIENQEFIVNPKRAEKLLEKLEQGDLKIDDQDPIEQQKFLKFIEDANNQDKIVKEWLPWWQNTIGVRDLSGNVINIESNETSDNEQKKDKAESKNDQQGEGDDWENLEEEADFNEMEKGTIKRREEVLEKITKFIPNLEALIPRSRTASPLIIHNIISICFGVSYLLRVYNGELLENHEEVSQKLVKLCPPLLNDFRRYLNTTKEAIILGQEQLKMEEGIFKNPETGLKSVLLNYKDLSEIFSYKFYIAEILLEIYECVGKYDNSLTLSPNTQKLKKDLSVIKNKVIYYVSYLKRFDDKEFKQVKNEIEKCAKENESYLDLYEKMEEIKKDSSNPFKVIE